MAETKIEGAHGLPRDTNTIYDELQQVIHSVGRRDANKTIESRSALRYYRRVITCVNKEEENIEGQKIKMTTGTIKVYGLIHNREKKSDLRLAWEMFHKIYHMYSGIKNKEEKNTALVLTSMSDHKDIKRVIETTVNSHENPQKKILSD